MRGTFLRGMEWGRETRVTRWLVCLGLVVALACGGEQTQPPAGEAEAPAEAEATPTAPSMETAEVPPSGRPPTPQPVLDVVNIPATVEDPEEAVAKLREKLADSDPEIREAAILALWDVETETANQAMADAVRNEREAELKSYLMEELVDREAPQALETAALILSDPNPDLREQAAEALETLDRAEAVAPLRAALESEQNADVRDAIVSALEELDPTFEAPE